MCKIDPDIPYAVKTDWNHHVQAAYSSLSLKINVLAVLALSSDLSAYSPQAPV